MLLAHSIESNGYMLEPVMVPEGTQDNTTINGQTVIVTKCPDGFYKPQWSSGQWVDANAPTQAEQLASAQQAQIAEIDTGYQATIDAGFQATIASTKYTFGWQVQDRLDLQMVQSAIDKQIETFPIDYADIHGNAVSIADQTTLTALDKTANSFSWAQTKQRRSLIAQIKQATTVSAVQAVTWTTASY